MPLELGFCHVQTPPEIAHLIGQPSAFRRRLRQLRGRAACFLVGLRGGHFGRLQAGPRPFHRRRRGRHPCCPDGPEAGLFRWRLSAGSFAALRGPVPPVRSRGGGRRLRPATPAVAGAAPVPVRRGGMAPRDSHGAGEIDDVDPVRRERPEQTAALHGGCGARVGGGGPQGLLHFRRDGGADGPSVLGRQGVCRLYRAGEELAPLLGEAAEVRCIQGVLRGLHRGSQPSQLPQDFGAVRRQHVHRPRRHRRLGQGTDFGRQGTLLGGGDAHGTDVFGRGRSCSHELPVGQCIERPGNAR